MMKSVFLFPGQGAQTVGMGRSLHECSKEARSVFEEANDALGFDLSELIFNGPEKQLNETEYTQPAILTASVAAARALQGQLQDRAIEPTFLAGHSLGEYSAHVVAGTITFNDAVRTVRSRGRYMQEAVPLGLGSMAAILGLASATIDDICAKVSGELAETFVTSAGFSSSEVTSGLRMPIVSAANLNSPDQTVISGSRDAVKSAIELCKEAGAKRAVLLQVSAPFHCALMQSAQDRLATDLEGLVFDDPRVPVVCNVDARLITRRSDARDCLIRQVTGSVRWVESMRLLISEGADTFIELGPGKVLGGLLRQIDRSRSVLHVEDRNSLEKTLIYLEGTNAN